MNLQLPADCDGCLWLHQYAGLILARHRHRELEFNLVRRGSAVYLLEDRKYVLNSHALVWLFPNQEHVLLDQSPDFEMWIGVSKPRLLRRSCMIEPYRVLLKSNPPGQFCRRLGQAGAERLDVLFAQIIQGQADPVFFNSGLSYALLCAWKAYQSAVDMPAGDDVHPAVEKAAYLLRIETEPLKRSELSRRAGLSCSRLSRLFKQQIGLSLVDFRNKQRLERFLRLYGGGLRKKTLSAALEAGFGSYPQFHRVFKQLMGCSPAAYRRNLVNRGARQQRLFSE